MKRYICWEQARIDRYVGDGIEERSSRDSFFERHVPVRLGRADMYGALGDDPQDCDEEEFLEEFLAKGGSSILTGLIGESGHGKTHLVAWVHARLNQDKDKDRKVLLIPRTETSLPSIFERLLEGVPESERAEFEEMYERVREFQGTQLTPYDFRLRLFNGLVTALSEGLRGMGGGDAEESKSSATLVTQYRKLVEEQRIVPLLQSEPLREFLMQEGGVLDQVVSNSLTKDSAYNPDEDEDAKDQQEFLADHLPVENWEAELTANNQRHVKKTVQLFRGKRGFLADLLNQGVQEAVESSLSKDLTLESAESFLVDIRKAIARAHPGRELVLLIEDLARTKFIDEDLVKACTADAATGDSEMATMRTLFATTQGLYERLQVSTQQRVNGGVFVLGHDWATSAQPWVRFGASYLSLFRKDGPETCSRCSHQETCFDTFGEEEEQGLYPLNKALLAEMGGGGRSPQARGFHPRTFLRNLARSSSGALEDIETRLHPRSGFGSLESVPVDDLGELATFVEGLGLGEDLERAKRALRAYGIGEGAKRRITESLATAFELPTGLVDPSKLGATPTPKPEPKPEPKTDLKTVPTPQDPLLERIKGWQGSDGELNANSEERLQKATLQVLLGAPHFWEARQLPRLVRDQVLDVRSLVFHSSASATGQGKPLAVELRVPLGETPEKRGLFREPYRLTYELDTFESRDEHLGWDDSNRGGLNVHQYLRLARAQDELTDEVVRQVKDVFGSRASEGGAAIQALISGALQHLHSGQSSQPGTPVVELPSTLEPEPVVGFLRQLRTMSGPKWSVHTGEGSAPKCDELAKACLYYLGGWKGTDKALGEPLLLDLYRAEKVTQELTHLQRPLPENIREKRGRRLGQLADQARQLPSRLDKAQQEALGLQGKFHGALRASGLSDWGPGTRGEVRDLLEELRGEQIGNLDGRLRRINELVQQLESHHGVGLLQLSAALDGSSYEKQVACCSTGFLSAVQGSLDVLQEIDAVLSELEKGFRVGGQGTNMEKAKVEFVEAYEALVTGLKQGEVG